MANRLSGDRELRAALRSIAESATGPSVDRAMVESLRPMKDATVSNALRLRQPGKSPPGGHLDQGVTIAPRQRSRAKRIYWLTFTKRARKIAHLVEFGTAPHWQPNYRGGWMHPGARPKPFARPAFEQNKEEVLSTFGRLMWLNMRMSMIRASKGRR